MGKVKVFGVFIASCVLYFLFCSRVLFRFTNFIQSPFAAISLILSASIITLLIYLQVSKKKFHKVFIYCFYVPYILALGRILLGRKYTFRGLELNPLAFISYFSQPRGSFENFMNIMLFVPIGILLSKAPKKKIIPLSLIGILCIETLQYITYSGVFDLSDVLLNFLGIYLGLNIGAYFARKGVKVVNSFKDKNQICPEVIAQTHKEELHKDW